MQKLKKDQDFLVQENGALYIALGIVFLVMFVVTLTDKQGSEWEEKYNFRAMYLALLPALFFIYKGFARKRTIMKINSRGFYYSGQLLTGWNDFVDARVDQDQKIMSIKDHFVLNLRFKNRQGQIQEEKIPLTNTQNRSEEEIIEAIRFYCKP